MHRIYFLQKFGRGGYVIFHNCPNRQSLHTAVWGVKVKDNIKFYNLSNNTSSGFDFLLFFACPNFGLVFRKNYKCTLMHTVQQVGPVLEGRTSEQGFTCPLCNQVSTVHI